jgi:hypothetical protein
MKPTYKNKEIEDQLTKIAGISRQEAAERNICTWCKKPHTPFRDNLSAKEATISGLCQSCQDETFGNEINELGQAKELLRRYLASHNDDRFCECMECRETRLFLSRP